MLFVLTTGSNVLVVIISTTVAYFIHDQKKLEYTGTLLTRLKFFDGKNNNYSSTILDDFGLTILLLLLTVILICLFLHNFLIKLSFRSSSSLFTD